MTKLKTETKQPQHKHVCPACNSEMYEAHCKTTCPNCGYKEDCTDLFVKE